MTLTILCLTIGIYYEAQPRYQLMSLTIAQKKLVGKLLWPNIGSDIESNSAPALSSTHTYLRSQYLGPGTAKSITRIGTTFHSPSLLFVCPTCGEPWAKIIVERSPWRTELRPCPTHGPGILGMHSDAYTMPYLANINDIMAGLTPAEYQSHLITRGK